jgi:hypothetical protein
LKIKWKIVPKYFYTLLGAILVVMVIQYALLTGLIRPVHLIFELIQFFCYLLLAVAIFRGFIERSRLAWLVAQLMLVSLFSFSLLFTVFTAILSFQSQGLWLLFGLALLTSVLNGILLGVLFSLPVCDYFRPRTQS